MSLSYSQAYRRRKRLGLPSINDLTLEERFWPAVEKSEGCWLWTRSKSRADGYGHIQFKGQNLLAHRVSWELANGPIPDGMLVCHHCDNPPCVRPDHLFLGTMSDNLLDAVAKGRARNRVFRGEDNVTARLTANQVRAIRAALAAGGTKRGLGRQFGVSATTVYDIATGKSWGHLQ